MEQSDHSTELRYDMGFTNYPVANDGIATGLNYNQEFDWTHGQENVYAPRAMYPMLLIEILLHGVHCSRSVNSFLSVSPVKF